MVLEDNVSSTADFFNIFFFYHDHREWFLKNQSAISSAEYMVLRDILGASLNSGNSAHFLEKMPYCLW